MKNLLIALCVLFCVCSCNRINKQKVMRGVHIGSHVSVVDSVIAFEPYDIQYDHCYSYKKEHRYYMTGVFSKIIITIKGNHVYEIQTYH